MYIGIDLGTTNIKSALYDGEMHLLGRASAAAGYMRTGDLVEFDADEYFDALIRLLRDLTGGRTVRQLAFTGQAETTSLPVSVPAVSEAACLGAAMVAAVGDGRFADDQEAAGCCVRLKRTFCPEPDAGLEEKYARFRRLYELSLEIQKH